MQKKVRLRGRANPARWAAVIALGAVLALLSLALRIWPGNTTSGPVPLAAQVSAQYTADAPLRIGAAAVQLALPEHVALAGFGPFRPTEQQATSPLFARAVSFGPFAMVALDLLEIPRALQAAVSERLPGRVVWVCATHTHSGPGGYDPSPLAQLAGARRFDGQIFATLVNAAVSAVEQAERQAVPAQLKAGKVPHGELKRGRSAGATPDPSLWAIAADTLEGQRIATLVGFGAHPTIVPKSAALLSPDWPGEVAHFLDHRAEAGSVGLVVQGVGGDSSVVTATDAGDLKERIALYAAHLLSASALTFMQGGRVRGDALSAMVRPVDVTFAPVLGIGTHLTTAVGIAKVGGVTLVCLPGELTGAALEDLTVENPWLKDAFVVTLCGDELSYIESPRLRRAGLGEKLVLFPNAVEELGRALGAATNASAQ